MKYAFMSFSTPTLSLAQMLTVAIEYGYDGLEPRLDADHAHGIEVETTAVQREAIKMLVAQSGVVLACLAAGLKYADPAQTVTVIDETHSRIDLAGDLAVPTLRVFGGAIPDGVSREQAIDLLVDSLGNVADHAAERGVTLCIETHDDWCDPAHVVEVVSRINHPAIAVNWDILHPVRRNLASIDEAFTVLKPWIKHVHIHDNIGENLQFAPIGTGDIDHRRAIELLQSMDYKGYLSGEWINWEAYDIHLPRELATLKSYES